MDITITWPKLYQKRWKSPFPRNSWISLKQQQQHKQEIERQRVLNSYSTRRLKSIPTSQRSSELHVSFSRISIDLLQCIPASVLHSHRRIRWPSPHRLEHLDQDDQPKKYDIIRSGAMEPGGQGAIPPPQYFPKTNTLLSGPQNFSRYFSNC